MRATELVKHLSLEKSVRGAIKIVTSLKLPNLAERFNSILEVSFQFSTLSLLHISTRVVHIGNLLCFHFHPAVAYAHMIDL